MHEDALKAEYLDELTQLSTQPSCAYSFCEFAPLVARLVLTRDLPPRVLSRSRESELVRRLCRHHLACLTSVRGPQGGRLRHAAPR